MNATIRPLVCIPTYNERENVERIVPAVLESAPDADILIIDDNSPDGTGQLADALEKSDNRVHVLHRPDKGGLGLAYRAGFTWARARGYNRIIEFDADFSHNPTYLPEMLTALEKADVVVGSRRVPGGGVVGWGPLRKAVSAGGSLYARTVLQVPIRDLTGGFNGFRMEALEAIDFNTISATGYMFQIEIKYRCVKQGLRVVEMPIVFPDRERGSSKMSPRIFAEALIGVMKLRLAELRKDHESHHTEG